MDFSWWIIQIAVFAASLLQAATGIGFGVIAGPILLLILNSASAIQVSIILSLVIALVLAPSLGKRVARPLFQFLVIGTCIGIPLGIYVFLHVDIHTLKILAGLAVTYMALSAAGVIRKPNKLRSRGGAVNSRTALGIGTISGAMSSSLGMPGPVPATWMIARAFTKDVIRATILMLFIPSYCAAIVFQMITPGLHSGAVSWSLTLLPATIAGVLTGKALEPRISEHAFKKIITVVLFCTAFGLFADVAIKSVIGDW